jgi:hypothetical protein
VKASKTFCDDENCEFPEYMKQKVEIISKAMAEKLEAHAQVIHKLIAAQRRGAAEQFGYAFLAGRALLQAKTMVPNGNSRVSNGGFRNWVAANLPEITIRTAENWMFFAEAIIGRAQLDAFNSPLFLGDLEITGAAHDSILRLVPEIMDGKGMIRFMRDTRLLRAARRKRKLPCDVRSPRDEKALRARRLWERIVLSLGQAEKGLPHVKSAGDLNRYLNVVVLSGNKIRAAIKNLGMSQSN